MIFIPKLYFFSFLPAFTFFIRMLKHPSDVALAVSACSSEILVFVLLCVRASVVAGSGSVSLMMQQTNSARAYKDDPKRREAVGHLCETKTTADVAACASGMSEVKTQDSTGRGGCSPCHTFFYEVDEKPKRGTDNTLCHLNYSYKGVDRLQIKTPK